MRPFFLLIWVSCPLNLSISHQYIQFPPFYPHLHLTFLYATLELLPASAFSLSPFLGSLKVWKGVKCQEQQARRWQVKKLLRCCELRPGCEHRNISRSFPRLSSDSSDAEIRLGGGGEGVGGELVPKPLWALRRYVRERVRSILLAA
nr:protein FAM19A4 isoform X2 [Zonotrichia albicollis]